MPCSFLAIVGIPVLFFTPLTLVAMFPLRRGSSQTGTTRRIAIVIPAHDESLLITKTVEMAKAQKYPANCFPVFVIANACSDDTAAKAENAGARVLERHENTGKSPVVPDAFSLLTYEDWDAFLVVDIDSHLPENALPIANKHYAAGV